MAVCVSCLKVDVFRFLCCSIISSLRFLLVMEHGNFSVKDAVEKKEEQIIFLKTGSLLIEVFIQIFSHCNGLLNGLNGEV